MSEGMSKATASALHDTKFWEKLNYLQIADFQLNTVRLCMPFDVFQEAVEKALGRPVFTHEFAFPESLIQELQNPDICEDCGEPTKDPDDRFCPPCQLQRDIEQSELYLDR